MANRVLKTDKKDSGSSSENKFNIKSILIIAAIVLVLWWLNERVVPGVLNGNEESPVAEQSEAQDSDVAVEVEKTTQPVDTGEKECSQEVQAEQPEKLDDVKSIGGVNVPSRVGDNQIVEHSVYVLSYNNTHEQADWVFYKLTKSMINGQTIRSNDFREDPMVKLVTASTDDYRGSGYSRGHLCPSADIRTDEEANSETFYMSNMSPQLSEFNGGIWNDLEGQVRHWARKHNEVWVATGPVLKKGLKKIGRNTKVSVPELYYKIVYSSKSGGRMIAFVMPNEDCEGHTYDEYVVTVDEIEEMTGIDFFPGVANEASLESKTGSLGWWN